MNSTALTGTLATLTIGATIFSANVPSAADMRKAGPESWDDIRTSYFVSAGVVIASGLVVSGLTSDPQPLSLAILLSVAMCVASECLLQATPSKTTDKEFDGIIRNSYETEKEN